MCNNIGLLEDVLELSLLTVHISDYYDIYCAPVLYLAKYTSSISSSLTTLLHLDAMCDSHSFWRKHNAVLFSLSFLCVDQSSITFVMSHQQKIFLC